VKIVKFKSVRVFAFVVAMTAAIICCDSENPISTTASGPTPSSQVTPTVTPHEIRRSDGGRTFVKADGWSIPSLAAAEREEFETSITTAGGRSVKVYRTVIKTDPLSLFTGNPLHLIGMRSKDIRINKVKEYRTSAGIFCYKFLVNDADVDENTNKVRSTRGLLYPYSYYDEDGDGVFESLVFDEKDRFGHQGFEGEPHVPEWAIAKDQ
jgi:hypothetical protein